MDLAIQVCFYIVGLPLEVLAVSALLRTGFRRYPLVFLYVITVFVLTVVEMPTALKYYSDITNKAVTEVMIANYWRDMNIVQPIIFLTVINLLYAATPKLESRRMVRLALIAGAILVAGTSYLIHYDADVRPGIWMTPWTRDLKFSAVILDLALWALLISAKEKNRVLLVLSGGLGIMLTGGAIGEAIRNLATANRSHLIATAGGLVVMLADLMLLYILWQVFRKEPDVMAPRKEPPVGGSFDTTIGEQSVR